MARSGTGKVIDAGVMTGVAVLRGRATSLDRLRAASYTMHWTGTPTGTWAFFVSNKDGAADGSPPDTSVAANWTQLTLTTSPTNPSGAAGQTGLDLPMTGYHWIYPQYTNSASTGVLDMFFQGKD